MDSYLVLGKQKSVNIHLGEKRLSFFLIILSLSICIFNNFGDYLKQNVCSNVFLHSKLQEKIVSLASKNETDKTEFNRRKLIKKSWDMSSVGNEESGAQKCIKAFCISGRKLKGGRQTQNATEAAWLMERPSPNNSYEKQLMQSSFNEEEGLLNMLQAS